MKKIKDYKLFLENKQSKEDIDSICKKYDITNYTINDDGSIDVNGSVHLSNKELTKLPLRFGKVSGNFDCSRNNLKTLEGCPKYVGSFFSCCYNNLKTLDGGPETVLGEYLCYSNKLINFSGFPEDFDGYVDFSYNPVSNILNKIPLVESYKKCLKFIYWCNEFDAIDDEGNVIPERMEEVYNKLGMVYED